MKVVLLNIILAIILFFTNGLLGRLQYGYRGRLFEYGRFTFDAEENGNFAGNFFLKVVNPAIYIAVLCAIFQKLQYEDFCISLWLIIPAYWALRLVYIIAKNYFLIINWKYEIFSACASVLLGEGVFSLVLMPLIRAKEEVFISVTELRDAVWFAIIAYIAKVIWDIGKTIFTAEAIYPDDKRQNLIYKKYDALESRYGNYITELLDKRYPVELQATKGNFVCLLYAIMIFEDYNRPPVYRFVERVIKFFRPQKEMTLGIMQVGTVKGITNRESIRLGIEKLLASYVQYAHNCPIDHAISNYNGGSTYIAEVLAIYNELLELLSIDELIEDIESYQI